MVDIGATSSGASLNAARRGPEGPHPRLAPARRDASAMDAAEDPHAAALAILAQQRRENPARFALGLTTALSRETDPLRIAGVKRRIREFAAGIRRTEAESGIVKGSALDQWLVAARSSEDDPRYLQRLRDLTVPLGQAAIAADRTTGSKRGPVDNGPRTGADAATPAWLDPRRPEASKAEIVAAASKLDEAGLRSVYAATVEAARSAPADLAGELRRSGHHRAASELAEVARRRGLALDHVESDRARRKSREADKGR